MVVLEVAPPQELVAADLPPDPLLVVEVTQEDIDNGVPANGAFCPIARAMSRLGCQRVSVSSRSVTWLDHKAGFYRSSDLPREAVRFIRAFDTGCKFLAYRPFTFALQLPVMQDEAGKAAETPWLGGLFQTYGEGELLQWNYNPSVWNYKVHKTAPPTEKVSASP